MIITKLNCQAKPNPQGKGLVPVLQDWSGLQTGVLGPKSPADFIRDYCISSLILSANFRFKPVVEKPYFLYANEHKMSLSLIAPHEWGQYQPGEFLGTCQLRRDMTWAIDLSELEEHSPALAIAREFVREFIVTFSKQDSIRRNLPFYVKELPYYRGRLATALASSLQRSLPEAGDDAKALFSEQRALFSIMPSLLQA